MWLILKSLLKVGTKILPIPNFLYMLIGGNYLEFILIGITLRKISNHIKNGIYIDLSNKYFILNLILFFVSILYVFVFRGILICFFVLVFILIFIYALNFKSYILSNPVLVFIGNISFIVYLIHQNIGYQLLLFFYNFVDLIYIIFVFTIIILISTFIYYFYEKKIQLK